MTLPQMEGYNLMNLLQMKYYYIHVNVRSFVRGSQWSAMEIRSMKLNYSL